MSNMLLLGEQMRSHRKRNGMSQMALANKADSTPRYVSFIETGRSRPGRAVVLKISKALNLSLRDTNSMLLAAGLPAIYVEPAFDDAEMEPVLRVIKEVLRKHEPYPAWVIGPGLHFLDSNQAAERVFPGLVGQDPKEMIKLWCAKDNPLGSDVRTDTIFQLLDGLRYESFHYPHPVIPALLDLVENFAKGLERPASQAESPIMCPTLYVAGKQVRTLSTVMRFDKGANITMAEIRIELVFPADKESDDIFQQLGEEEEG